MSAEFIKSRHAAAVLFVVVLLVGGWLRFRELGHKPIHADEAVQGWKTGVLVGEGEYRYDPADHHGPTLYYLAAPIAWLAGERSLPEINVRTLRLLPATAGFLLIAATAFALLRSAGFSAALFAGAFAATSPLLVYYSRHFIQEMLFVLFTWLILVSLWHWFRTNRTRWILAAGGSFGLLVATKETWPLTAAAIGAGWLVFRFNQPPPQATAGAERRNRLVQPALAALLALAVAATLFSSFYTHPAGVVDAWNALWLGAGRAGDGGHAAPWHTHLSMLIWNTSAGHTWTEAAVLVFAALSIPAAFAKRTAASHTGMATRFLLGYTVFLAVAYSIIPYKTPWLACGFWHAAIVLAGLGAARWTGGNKPHAIRLLFGTAATVACLHLAGQTLQLTGRYSADPRNPYAYVQTSADLDRLPGRLEALAAAHPLGREMVVKIAVPDYWPLPWLLRPFPNTGFWEGLPPDPRADVLLIRSDLFSELPEEFREGRATEIFGLREGVLLIMAVEQAFWEKSLPPEN